MVSNWVFYTVLILSLRLIYKFLCMSVYHPMADAVCLSQTLSFLVTPVARLFTSFPPKKQLHAL